MSKINVVTVTNGQNISAINANFASIATHLNNLVSYRNSPVGEPNEMHNDIDFNSFRILNLSELNVTSLVVDGIAIDDAIFQTEANAQAAQVAAASAAASASQAAASVANSLSKVNNLSDVASPSVSRTNLGLGSVDNTADINKPISTATQNALNLKAPIASPVFTGITESPNYIVNNTAGISRAYQFKTAGVNRWFWNCTATTESGSNAGSDLVVGRYNDAGVFLDNPISIIRSTGAVSIKGTSTNDSAATGFIGEYVSNTTSGVSLTAAVVANTASISLTAGDWDVSGTLQFIPAGSTTTSQTVASISTTSVTLGGFPNQTILNSAVPAGNGTSIGTPTVRISLASTTTVYLVALSGFAVSTMTCNGFIRARRVR